MRLRLLYYTPSVEEVIATAVLTTCSKKGPISHFEKLSENPEKVGKVLEGLILKHGSVLEHNRFIWLLEADDGETLNLSVRHRFLEFSKLGEGLWLMSCNMRTMLEIIESECGEVAEAMLEALREASPTIYRRVAHES